MFLVLFGKGSPMPDYKHGKNLNIGQYVVIEEDCQLGDNVTIEEFVVLKTGTIIGHNCHIHAGAKIGAPAFDFKSSTGPRKRTHQKGLIIIGNNVDIGFNTVIQRGVEGNTIIGENTYINNLCNIGHDVQIGKGCTIGLGTRMSGYTEIGEAARIAPGVTIMNRVKIGRDAFVGIGSLVLHDVGNGAKVTGRPAIELAKHKAERKALKKVLGLDPNTQAIATKKRLWQRIVKQIKIRVLPNR